MLTDLETLADEYDATSDPDRRRLIREFADDLASTGEAHPYSEGDAPTDILRNYCGYLIPESEFEDHARELAEGCGMTPETATWPLYCIDWPRAARDLAMDYTSTSFDGIDYYIR